ncbi:MAG: TonB-dependent receptor, partial [Acidobacteria bacterium]|nr:TonB-dependent receptor [Acidobacteriota bacterium]
MKTLSFVIFVIITVLWTVPAFGQLSAQNPLDELKGQVAQVLVDAGVPFTPEQDRQMALLIEEQRQASEDLFGQIMDFRSGVPQGQELDRALAGIQWIHDEFRKKFPSYLSDEQRAAWEKFESGGAALGVQIESPASTTGARTEIQQIRINNNPFTTENPGQNNFGGGAGVSFGGAFAVGGGNSGGGNFQGGGGGGNFQGGGGNFQGGGGGGNFQNNNRNNNNNNNNRSERTEIIQRGGTGAFHGNFSANFQDESLNARNPYAINKPPYNERTINGNFSGPLMRDRLTITLTFNDNRQENVGTVKAETLEGPFSLGVTRPNLTRQYNVRGIYQLSEAQSLHFGGRYGSSNRKNEGVGDFSLPSRAINSQTSQKQFELRQISVLSPRSVYETRFSIQQYHNQNRPALIAQAINVLDAFRGGGAQENNEQHPRNYQFGNLFYRTGDKVILRAGIDGQFRRQHSSNESNFTGEYTFSDLESYRNGVPLKYRITLGNPRLDLNQLELAFFVQNDLRVTNRFTFMYGARYENQTNLHDRNNFDPRLAV